jgi:hypothetical protein
MSTKSFQTNGRAKIRIKFFKYSASREYMLQPDAVEYDENTMTKPGLDQVLGPNTLKELCIVLDFQTKQITLDDISLPLRDIEKLKTRVTRERAWAMKSSIYQSMSKDRACLMP